MQIVGVLPVVVIGSQNLFRISFRSLSVHQLSFKNRNSLSQIDNFFVLLNHFHWHFQVEIFAECNLWCCVRRCSLISFGSHSIAETNAARKDDDGWNHRENPRNNSNYSFTFKSGAFIQRVVDTNKLAAGWAHLKWLAFWRRCAENGSTCLQLNYENWCNRQRKSLTLAKPFSQIHNLHISTPGGMKCIACWIERPE